MSYAVSASYERSDHMSPVAALLAALLHVATALAVFWVSPLNQRDIEVPTVDVTIEQPKSTEPPPVQEAAKPQPQPTPPPQPLAAQPAPPPPPPPAAAKPEPKPQEQIASKLQPGVQPPAPVKPDPPKQATTKPAEATLEPQKPAEPKPPEPKEVAAAPPPSSTPPPKPEPPLEKVMPPVEPPPAPLTMRDFVKVMPPPPVPRPTPQPPPPPQHQQPPLQHSPLSTAPAPQPQTSPSASVSTFVNPAMEGASTSAKNAYLVTVLRKFAQYLPNLREKNEGGTVVLRFVIARDGHLVDATILKSSGVMALDKGMLETLRAASPYPPLPPEITENQVVFVQPIQARQ